MEFEDIVKRVQWLDDQQRKSKTELTELTGRLASLGTTVNALTQQIKTLGQQTHDFSVAAARIEQFDEIIVKHRADVAKMVEPIEKSAVKREQEILRLQRAELEDLRKSIFEVRSTITSDEAARRDRAHEEQRRTLALQDMRSAMDALVRQTKDVQDAQKTLDEAQRQESKRLADLQGELASVRKRTDEAREKVAVHSDGLRNVENRLSELAQVDNTRQEQHAALIQQQALAQVERDRAWKEWQERYEGFKKQAVAMENQVSAFEDAIRAAQKAQEAYDGLNQRLERRIAEVGEVQRLAEERIRQEWVAFKADEQKRWTGHSLSQDESIRDLRKDVDKIAKGITALDDAAQTMQDQLHQTTETTEQQLQELMNVTQEWLSAYERIMGHAKTKVKKAVR
jgi:chromosome segregation ATPase